MLIKKISILSLALCLILTGCSSQAMFQSVMGSNPEENTESIVERAHHEAKNILEQNRENTLNEAETITSEPFVSHATPLYDFEEDIVKKHKILEYNICTSPRMDYESTVLAEYLMEEVEEDREWCEKTGIIVPVTVDYNVFDFNGDGLDDYIVCMDGYCWSGSGGHVVRIYVQEKDGTLRKILNINMRLHTGEMKNGVPVHARLTVLEERTDGYYAIVTPEFNRILRYEKEEDCYEFHDGE